MRLEIVIGGEHALLNQHTLQRINEDQQVLGIRIADVIHAMSGHWQTINTDLDLRSAVHDPAHALHNIVHVRKVALTIAHVENLNRIATTQLLGEAEVCHVGPSHGPIHRKEAQARGWDGVKLGVGRGH